MCFNIDNEFLTDVISTHSFDRYIRALNCTFVVTRAFCTLVWPSLTIIIRFWNGFGRVLWRVDNMYKFRSTLQIEAYSKINTINQARRMLIPSPPFSIVLNKGGKSNIVPTTHPLIDVPRKPDNFSRFDNIHPTARPGGFARPCAGVKAFLNANRINAKTKVNNR